MELFGQSWTEKNVDNWLDDSTDVETSLATAKLWWFEVCTQFFPQKENIVGFNSSCLGNKFKDTCDLMFFFSWGL